MNIVFWITAYLGLGVFFTYHALYFILKWLEEAHHWGRAEAFEDNGIYWFLGVFVWPIALPEMLVLAYMDRPKTKSRPKQGLLTRRLARRLDASGVFEGRP